MAQFVENIQCLYCLKTSESQSCENCPINTRTFFKFKRNSNSSGSQTPHTNLNLATFKKAEEFFKELSISLNHETVQTIKNELKELGIYKSQKVGMPRYNEIVNILRNEGCYWLYL